MLRLTWKEWLTAPFMAGISFYGRYFLLWSFHKRYKVMNSTCYIFPPLFLFHWCSQVVTNFTFTSETYVILLLLKCLPSNATKKSFVKLWNTNWKKHFLTLYEMFIWDASFYSVFQFLNNFPDLPRFTSLVFSIGRWNLTALFLDNIQGFWTIIHSWKLEIFPLKVTSYNAPLIQISPELSAH